jgi:quinol-cytochrome oxidoreductase complex cytochrome b subunit
MTSLASRSKRKWVGKWIAAVGVLHAASGFFLYSEAWRTIAERNVVASIRDHDETAAAFWFLAAGGLLILLGCLIDWVDRNSELPRWLGWALAALLLLLIVPMPATGAWTLLPPVLALLIGRRSERR